MSLFDWKDEYSVGIAELDGQHKKLVDALNRLFSAMRDGGARDVSGSILSELVQYAKTHFTYEEDLMTLYNYPGFADQKKAHEVFIQKIGKFLEKYRQGKFMLSLEIMNFMKEWLREHIVGSDKQYTDFFRQKGVR